MKKEHSQNMDLFICFGGSGSGGGDKIVAEIANYLPKSITRKIVTIYDKPLEYDIQLERSSLVHFHQSIILRMLSRPLILVNLLLLNLHEKPRLCLGVSPNMCIYLMLTKIITKCQVIISVHTMPSYYGTSIVKLLKYIEFTLARWTNTPIIAVSHGVKNEIMQMHHIKSENIYVIYNPMNIAFTLTKSTEPINNTSLTESIPYIITVGRLFWVKGQWHIIRAFAQLRNSHHCHLLICGDGEEGEYLTNLAKELGISNDVIFLGWQDNPYKYMAKSRLFVLSSISEALPNVIIESMACGCPVVSADCSPGISEIMGNDNTCGLIAAKMTGIRHGSNEPLDEGEQSLLECMEEIISNPELHDKMSSDGKERSKMFDMDIGIQNYVDLIEDLIGKDKIGLGRDGK